MIEQLDMRKAPGLTGLKEDWRNMLFPHATDAEFADGYAQAVTFGLLMAKARGISLKGGIDDAAKVLRKSNSLIGSALRLLTEEADERHTLDTSLKTLTAVLDVVNWGKISKDRPEAWLYFYELFLQSYDKALRKKTGSYYTPPEIVTAMVRLVDEALRSPKRFHLPQGLATPAVTLADPAVGTGTFLLGVLQSISNTVESDEGAGSVPAAITAALQRLIGFELQFGPFAVAQLRLLAELISLVTHGKHGEDIDEALEKALSANLRLYITDTLADPDEETAWIPQSMAGIAESRREANRIKRHEAITVVLGNPPYKEKAKGLGGWVEDRGKGLRAPLDDWQPPVEWGVGAHTKHLRNLYVYFWRWAAWKVFGGDPYRGGTDKSELNDWTHRRGIVSFISVAGFLNGPGFRAEKCAPTCAATPTKSGSSTARLKDTSRRFPRACSRTFNRRSVSSWPCVERRQVPTRPRACGSGASPRDRARTSSRPSRISVWTTQNGTRRQADGARRSCRNKPRTGQATRRSKICFSTTAPAS